MKWNVNTLDIDIDQISIRALILMEPMFLYKPILKHSDVKIWYLQLQ